MTLSKTAKNTSIYTVALVIQKVISFIYFSYLAVSLGPENLGLFSYCLSVIATAVILTDLGINNVITRESAADNSKTKSLYLSGIKLKLSLSLITLILLFGYVFIFETDVYLRIIIIFASLSMFGDTFANTAFAGLRGLQKLNTESIMAILVPLISAILGVVVLLTSKSLILLAISLSVGSWFAVIFANLSLKKETINNQLNLVSIKSLIKLTTPFAIASLSTKIYGYADTIILRFLSNPLQIGLYGLAYKATFALQFIPIAAMAGVYPAMSNSFADKDDIRLYNLLSNSIKYVLVLGFPLVAVISIFGKDIIHFIYGLEYDGAIIPLLILFYSIPFLFCTFPLSAWLNATHQQKINTINVVLTTFISIILNIIYIPKFGALGAATVSLITSIVLFSLHLIAVLKNYKFILKFKMIINVLKIFLTLVFPLITGFVCQFYELNLFIGLLITTISYILSLAYIKVVPKVIGQRIKFLKFLCQK